MSPTVIGLPYPCPPFTVEIPSSIPRSFSTASTYAIASPATASSSRPSTIASPATASSSKPPTTTTPSSTTRTSNIATAITTTTTTTTRTTTTKERHPLATCATCASTAYESHILLPCTHSYCPACFTNLITTSLSPSNLTSEFPPKCPLPHSYTPEKRPQPPAVPNPAVPLITSNPALPTTLIKTHCPTKVYDRYRILTARLAISPDRSWYCPNSACGALSDRWRMCKVFGAVRCRKCKTWGCVKCEKKRRLPGWHRCKGKPWEVDPEVLARGLRIFEEEERVREARRKLNGLGSESEEESGSDSESESERESHDHGRLRVRNEEISRKGDGSD